MQCVFAEGSPQDNCTVILVLNGVEQRRERFSGEMTFSELVLGSYTVLVFDSEPEMEGSGYDQVPALERTVEVTGVTVTTTSFSDDPSSIIGESWGIVDVIQCYFLNGIVMFPIYASEFQYCASSTPFIPT